MVRFTQAFRLATFGMLFSGLIASLACAQDETLIPARPKQLMDKRANRWDLDLLGIVNDGTNDCFDAGGVLRLDGSQLSVSRSMMTTDGMEYVFSGRHRLLTVTRRVRLDAEAGALRYLEIFENQGKTPQRVVAAIHTNLGNSARQIVTAQDKLLLGGLGKEDGAFVAVQSDNRPSVVFVVADPKAKTKPELRVSNNRSFEVIYSAEIPAGGSVAFVHYLAQRLNGSANDARELLATYYKRGRLTDPTIPKAYQKLIANFNVGGAGGSEDEKLPPLLAPLRELAEGMGLSREKVDGLAIDAESKLTGTITGNDFSIETVWGKTPVAFADVAGIAGGAGVQRLTRVFLRNGEILTGAIRGAKFAMATDSGLSLEVDLDEIHFLTLRATESDGVAPPKAVLLVTTQHGDRLALSDTGTQPLEIATPWGTTNVKLAELRSLTSVREPFPSHRLVLADRSQLSVMLRGGEWAAPALRFGAVKIVPQNIRELQQIASDAVRSEAADDSPKMVGAHCELVGENRLAGVIDLPALHLTAESSVTKVEPKQILQIGVENSDLGGRSFTIKLIGGQELKGRIAETFLPIRNGSRVWRVPVAQFVAFRAPENEKNAEEKPAEEKKAEGEKVETVQKEVVPARQTIPGL